MAQIRKAQVNSFFNHDSHNWMTLFLCLFVVILTLSSTQWLIAWAVTRPPTEHTIGLNPCATFWAFQFTGCLESVATRHILLLPLDSTKRVSAVASGHVLGIFRLVDTVTTVEILPFFCSDLPSVYHRFSVPRIPQRGRGVWKINTSLLKECPKCAIFGVHSKMRN